MHRLQSLNLPSFLSAWFSFKWIRLTSELSLDFSFMLHTSRNHSSKHVLLVCPRYMMQCHNEDIRVMSDREPRLNDIVVTPLSSQENEVPSGVVICIPTYFRMFLFRENGYPFFQNQVTTRTFRKYLPIRFATDHQFVSVVLCKNNISCGLLTWQSYQLSSQ